LGKIRRKNKAVFIDRDGTIIREKNYLRRVKDLALLNGAVEGLRGLRSAGFKVIMVTNQSGIGRGYLTETKLAQIHAHLQKLLSMKKAAFDGVYYCRHLPEDGCACRKPRLGMVNEAAKKFNIDLKSSYSIGDHVNDLLLGQNMGGKGVFILTGHGKEEFRKIRREPGKYKPDHVAKNFREGAEWIIKNEKNR
jgi:histidinol-phosphate phosphatase family protein